MYYAAAHAKRTIRTFSSELEVFGRAVLPTLLPGLTLEINV